jgi:hypothetical protein
MFVTLGDLPPRWLGITQKLPSLWLSSRKFVLPSYVWGLIVKNRFDLGGHSERFRVERNPVLYIHLNGDVGIFVVLNFGNKSCDLCAQTALLLKFMFMFLPSKGFTCFSKITPYILAPSLCTIYILLFILVLSCS